MFNKRTHKLTYVLTLQTSNKKPSLHYWVKTDSAGLCRFRQSPAWVFPPPIHHASGFGSVSLGLSIPHHQSEVRMFFPMHSPNIIPSRLILATSPWCSILVMTQIGEWTCRGPGCDVYCCSALFVLEDKSHLARLQVIAVMKPSMSVQWACFGVLI